MRWVFTIIIAYVFVLFQTTVGRILTLERFSVGPFGPDFMAILVVFVALYARNLTDALLVAWIGGMMLDLTTAGGAGLATRVGVMPLCYVASAWMVFSMREGLYRDRFVPQMVVAAAFCFMSHFLWVLLQCLLNWAGWGVFGGLIFQVALSAVYTGLLAPPVCLLLMFARGLLIGGTAQRGRIRSRRYGA